MSEEAQKVYKEGIPRGSCFSYAVFIVHLIALSSVLLYFGERIVTIIKTNFPTSSGPLLFHKSRCFLFQ